MKKIIALLGTLFILAPISGVAALSNSDTQKLSFKSTLLNSGFENGTVYWTAGAGVTPLVDTTNHHDGNQSVSLALSSTSGTLFFQDVTPTQQFQIANFEFTYWVKTTVSGLQVCVRQAGVTLTGSVNCTAVPNDGKWNQVTVTGLAPSSGSIGLALYSSTSVTGTVNLDESYVGLNRNSAYTQTQKNRLTKNYIPFPDFENNSTTGWTQGHITNIVNGLPSSTSVFTFGSGQSGTSSISTVPTSAPYINGSYYLSYANSAATTQGDMIASSAITLDGQDRGAVLSVRFPFAAVSGTASFAGDKTNSFAVIAYDVTNSVPLYGSGNFCMAQSANVGTCSNLMFQTSITTAQIRLVVYAANATSGAFTLGLDDFYVGPSVYANGPSTRDLQSYTPTFTNMGTPTSVNFQWGQHGDNLLLSGSFVTGTGSASPLTISLPNGVTISSSKVSGTQSFGLAQASAQISGNLAIIGASNASVISIGYSDAVNGFTQQNGNFLSSGTTIGFGPIFIPINGWSSNTAIGQDAALGAVEARYYWTSNTTLGTTGDNIWSVAGSTQSFPDTNGMFGNTNKMTAPVTGYYNLTITANLTGTSTVGYNINGGSSLYLNQTPSGGGRVNASAKVYLAAGSYVQYIVNGTSGVTLNGGDGNSWISFARDASPQTISPAVSEVFDYYGSTQNCTTSAAAIINPTKLVDNQVDMNTSTGLATVKNSGTFACSCRYLANFGSANAFNLQFYVNGSAVSSQIQTTNGTTVSATIADELPVLSGQTIGCYVQGGASSSSALDASFSCHRVGF